MVLLPILYAQILDESTNNCCTDSAAFAPGHKLTVYTLITICVLFYFYSSLKAKIASPILEVLTNTMLLIGLIFNIIIAIHIEQPIWLIGNLPIGLLFAFELINNHQRFLAFSQTAKATNNRLEQAAWQILTASPLLKLPVLLVLALPVLVVITSLLLLFGQKPDSLIQAFTETYKHGFSQLTYQCNNAQCGGHFLCSVAAKGHTQVVKPIRYGERHQHPIICNRQLLVANAFEELIEEKLPSLHKLVRHNYNHVGSLIHRYYYVFDNKLIADGIYLLMKPLEAIFLLTLYTFDQRPENRIAQQYMSPTDRRRMAAYSATQPNSRSVTGVSWTAPNTAVGGPDGLRHRRAKFLAGNPGNQPDNL